MTNWKKVRAEIATKEYKVPAGWDCLESVAEDLEVHPDKVTEILSYGIKSGDILLQKFAVYEPKIGRVVHRPFLRDNRNYVAPDPSTVCKEYDQHFLAAVQKSVPLLENAEPKMSDLLEVYGHRIGCRIYSRWRKCEGTFQADGTAAWDNGKVSTLTISMFMKGDAKFVS